MADRPAVDGPEPDAQSPSRRRLDSWKQSLAHLGCHVTNVRRWERRDWLAIVRSLLRRSTLPCTRWRWQPPPGHRRALGSCPGRSAAALAGPDRGARGRNDRSFPGLSIRPGGPTSAIGTRSRWRRNTRSGTEPPGNRTRSRRRLGTSGRCRSSPSGRTARSWRRFKWSAVPPRAGPRSSTCEAYRAIGICSPTFPGLSPFVAVGPTGDEHLVWLQFIPSGANTPARVDVVYARPGDIDRPHTWAVENVTSTHLARDLAVNLAIDPSTGTPQVAMAGADHASDRALQIWSRNAQGAWVALTAPLDGFDGIGGFLPGVSPQVLALRSGTDLTYARWTGGSWETTRLEASVHTYSNWRAGQALAQDASGRPHVFGNYGQHLVFEGGTWLRDDSFRAATGLSASGQSASGIGTVIRFDAEDRAHVVWAERFVPGADRELAPDALPELDSLAYATTGPAFQVSEVRRNFGDVYSTSLAVTPLDLRKPVQPAALLLQPADRQPGHAPLELGSRFPVAGAGRLGRPGDGTLDVRSGLERPPRPRGAGARPLRHAEPGLRCHASDGRRLDRHLPSGAGRWRVAVAPLRPRPVEGRLLGPIGSLAAHRRDPGKRRERVPQRRA